MKYISVILFSVVFVLGAVKCATHVGKDIRWPNCDAEWPACEAIGRGRNTVCIVPHCGGREVDRCIEIKPGPMMRRVALDTHNDKRDYVAGGNDLRNKMTGAKNMRAFSYDLGLEYTAICHANICKMEHDKCRGTKKFQYAGQNLAMQGVHALRTDDLRRLLSANFTKHYILLWYDTEIILNPDWTASIAIYYFEHATGHLTAFLWAETTHMGCARSIWNQSQRAEYHLTCNYAPPGNAVGRPMFTPGKLGEGATDCPKGTTRNSKYSSLCGEIDDSQVNTGDNPYRNQELQAMKNAAHAVTIYRCIWIHFNYYTIYYLINYIINILISINIVCVL